jgi:hypothetical protein
MGRFQKKPLEHGSLGLGSVPAWDRFSLNRFERFQAGLIRFEQFEPV